MKFERRNEHRRNEKLEALLAEVNVLLASGERAAARQFTQPKYPVVLIVGAPRSGTTLFLQWLASLGCFAYPTNILSRFYGAPYIGAKIQLMLTKHDFNNEIFDFNPNVPFISRLGKTKGALAPNEFWYFWRRFFHFGEIQVLAKDALAAVDHDLFISELAAIEAAFDMPFALKAMILNWHIPFLASIIEKALFAHIRRHPIYNIQSLTKSRMDYFGDVRGWYSFKPPEYEFLKDKDPIEQVTGQIYYTNRAVEEGLSSIGDSRKLIVGYEDFCRSPAAVFERIKEKFREQDTPADWTYAGLVSFDNLNKLTLSENEVRTAIDFYERYSGDRVSV